MYGTACSGEDSQMLRKVVHVKALEENARTVHALRGPQGSAHIDG